MTENYESIPLSQWCSNLIMWVTISVFPEICVSFLSSSLSILPFACCWSCSSESIDLLNSASLIRPRSSALANRFADSNVRNRAFRPNEPDKFGPFFGIELKPALLRYLNLLVSG